MSFHLPLPVVATALRPYYRLSLNARLPYTVQRALLDLGAPLQQVPAGAVVRPTSLAGRPAERITVRTPPNAAPRCSTCTAGRTRSVRSPRTVRWPLTSPGNPAASSTPSTTGWPRSIRSRPGSRTRSRRTWSWTPNTATRQSNSPSRGDSAGGGLAVATARRLIDRHGVTPAALALIAPWVDPGRRDTSRDRDLRGQHGVVLRCRRGVPGQRGRTRSGLRADARKSGGIAADADPCRGRRGALPADHGVRRQARTSRKSTSRSSSTPGCGTSPTYRRPWSARPRMRSPNSGRSWVHR